MKYRKTTQLERVSAALSSGHRGVAEINIATGIGKRCISSNLWYLRQCNYDVDAARELKNRLSIQSKRKAQGSANDLSTQRAVGPSLSQNVEKTCRQTIPITINVPRDEFGTEWVDPEIDAIDRTVVEHLTKRTKHDDDFVAYLNVIEKKVGRDFILDCLEHHT